LHDSYSISVLCHLDVRSSLRYDDQTWLQTPRTHFLQPGPAFHSSTIFQESTQISNPSMDQTID
jgi:hypothetical protein